MLTKMLTVQRKVLLLCGIFFTIRLIVTRELHIQLWGYSINSLILILSTLLMIVLHLAIEKETKKEHNA
jgi:hypothetical protein